MEFSIVVDFNGEFEDIPVVKEFKGSKQINRKRKELNKRFL